MMKVIKKQMIGDKYPMEKITDLQDHPCDTTWLSKMEILSFCNNKKDALH